ncbi:DNA methylase N-4/N-6 [uncultured Caudovirales phage]|uniref:DNA methylase N-4/N-6 n=1 Tax=uncultured Caudovirales phage TaxID=2100421 RepID=A0A6J5LPG8_9CAUD|nr:DNA methylase N-4/N-6 [uncultured Caudovirales phage]
MKYQIINGNNIDVLKTFPDNHFDSIVTDPPYGIDFLGKSWDANTGALETYQECLRVLKPGGHILAFSAARTYHHLAITLEQAGFEIRDQIMWIYSSGFPKSQDVGRGIQRSLGVKERGAKRGGAVTGNDVYDGGYKGGKDKGQFEPVVATDPEAVQWSGWGTALKPAHEPIALARKPIKGSIKDNVLKHGVGALNIDATRIEWDDEAKARNEKINASGGVKIGIGIERYGNIGGEEQSNGEKVMLNDQGRFPANVLGDIPEYQKYFYCPKVSRKERHIGFDDPGPMFQGSRTDIYQPNKNSPDIQITSAEKKDVPQNNHPTVKPIALMKYLIKLITPPNGIVLDPFNGSGSTGCAAVELGCEYVGIELDPKYVEIATKRIEAWNKEDTSFKELFA